MKGSSTLNCHVQATWKKQRKMEAERKSTEICVKWLNVVSELSSLQDLAHLSGLLDQSHGTDRQNKRHDTELECSTSAQWELAKIEHCTRCSDSTRLTAFRITKSSVWKNLCLGKGLCKSETISRMAWI